MADHAELATPGRHIHVVGVGGAGMSAIATVLAQMGHHVSGSDLKESSGLARLRALGVDVHVGHAAEHVGAAELVTVSTAIPDHNPEVRVANDSGVPVWSRAEMLATLTRLRPTIAVAGTHGKTTTASMLALALLEAGLRPSFIIGGDVNEIGTGALWEPEGEWFVVEADESDGTFLSLARGAAVVTSVEADHLSFYGSESELIDAFDAFSAGTHGPVAVCLDDIGARRLADPERTLGYGEASDADTRIADYQGGRAGSKFILRTSDGEWPLELGVPGRHNAQNAAAAFTIATAVGADPDGVVRGLARYSGVARRYEFRGSSGGVVFVDDYAHLPTEVEATLDAAAAGGWDRLVTVFQPHRYTRTSDLWSTFADSFSHADLLIITDVYPAGETPIPGVSGKLIVDAVLDRHPWSRVAYLPRRAELVEYLTAELRADDLCLTLGAGDLTTLPDELLPTLADRP